MPFSYKSGNSFLHILPSWIKILFVPAFCIAVFRMPLYVDAVLCLILCALAFAVKISFKEQLKDFIPVVFYGVVLYLTGFAGRFMTLFFSEGQIQYNLLKCFEAAFMQSFYNPQTAFMLLKLFCMIQTASLFFKTSTSLQIREGIETFETLLRKILPVSKKNKFTDMISLFICFIPMVFKNWQQCRRAWLVRGGKPGIKMYGVLFTAFFSVSIKQTFNASRALLARNPG